VSLGLLYNQSPPGVSFPNKIILLQDGVISPMPNPHPGGPFLLLQYILKDSQVVKHGGQAPYKLQAVLNLFRICCALNSKNKPAHKVFLLSMAKIWFAAKPPLLGDKEEEAGPSNLAR
jgi:hypothetical protein